MKKEPVHKQSAVGPLGANTLLIENGATLKKQSKMKARLRHGCVYSRPAAKIVTADLPSPRETAAPRRTLDESFLGIVTAMSSSPNKIRKLAPIWRAMVEVGFIVFLFYSNLLMGEFTRTNRDGKSLLFAVQDIFTINNLVIAIISALIGYVVVEFLRKRI